VWLDLSSVLDHVFFQTLIEQVSVWSSEEEELNHAFSATSTACARFVKV
jgi:hypothetical protein